MKQIYTEHGVELQWDHVQSAEWTFKLVLIGPGYMIEVWLSTESIQYPYNAPEEQTQVHGCIHKRNNRTVNVYLTAQSIYLCLYR